MRPRNGGSSPIARVWGKRDRIEALLANPDTITAAINNAAPKPNAPKPKEKEKQDALIAQRVKDCISSMSDVQKPPDLKKLTWYLLGEVPDISLDQPIPLGKCATMVGQGAETPIRKLYER